MTDGLIPDEVRSFVLQRIDTVAQLEALLLLRKYPQTSWSAADVARRLYVGEAAAQEILAKLATDGLIAAADGAFRYSPAAETARIIDALADTYARYLIPVTNLIHDKPSRIQQFADAFRIRKDK
ncbi:MAG TPA: hypothetical protein VG843_07250 [Rhizomicrobium sp.]|jgi:hypothetical protein|nr:hypothetical protein [Rhizomicrobium sp.]